MRNYCAFRLDDITPDMKWDNFHQIKEIFDRYQIKPLIGVVPDNQDELLHYEEQRADFWKIIAELQKKGWAVAQHGYHHVYVTENKGLLKINPFSEFAGVSLEEQLLKIQNGREILQDHGITTNIFMPPGHTYDKSTLQALKQYGFIYVTDGYGRVPYIWEGIKFYPCRTGNYSILPGCNTICLHTNLMQKNDFIELEEFIKMHRDSLLDYNELLEVVPAVRRTMYIILQEKIDLWKFKGKRFVGHSKGIQRYMQATNIGKGTVKKCLRILGLPYCVVLILLEIWKGK